MSAEYEIDMTIPSASEPQDFQQQQEEEIPLTLEHVKAFLPHLEIQDLLEIQDMVNTLLKKKWKGSSGKTSKAKAKEDKPKKPASKALLRTQSWIAYVLKHCTENGWESFQTRQETKNKVTGEKELEVTERSGSKPNSSEDDADFTPYTYKNKETGEIIQPAHIFEDTGKHLTYKDAMTLIAILKWKEGARPSTLKNKSPSEEEERPHWSDLYVQFLEEYEEQHQESPSETEEETSSSSSSATSSPKVVRLTAAEKEEERQRRKQIAEEEKEQKRLAKEEEKEQKRLAKEEEKRLKEEQKQREKEEKEAKKKQEKEEKEAQKQREKEEKEAMKLAKKSPVSVPAVVIKKSPVPMAKPASPTKVLVPAKSTPAKPSPAPAKPTPAPAPAPAKPAPVKPAPKQLKKKEEEKEEKMVWNIPEDGMCHDWTFKGVAYVVNSDKGVWEKGTDDTPGAWVGMVDLEKNMINTSVPEPEYYDEE